MTAAVAIQNAYAPGLCVGEAEMGGGSFPDAMVKSKFAFLL